MSPDALLLIAHGSRDQAARAEYVRVRDALAARLPGQPIVLSVLEFPDDDQLPSIEDGVRRCARQGARRVAVLPFFLFPAGHVREDVPGELLQARASAGPIEFDLQPPLGAAEEILDVLEVRATEAMAATPSMDGDRTAVLLVGAGTSDADANADLARAARLFWERRTYPLVEVAWVSLTEPTVPEGVDRCVALGARGIVVVPYFLNTGVLLRRVQARLEAARSKHPEVPMPMAKHLGLHPRLIDLLERRAREALAADRPERGPLAVCGRSSCQSVVDARGRLAQGGAPARASTSPDVQAATGIGS